MGRVDDPVHEHALGHEPEGEERGGAAEKSHVGVDAEAGRGEPGEVHPPHHHVAVGEVHHPHHAEDEGEAHRHQAVDAAEEEAVQQPLDDERGIHAGSAGRGSGLRPRKDELLERRLPGPHRHRLSPQDLDHGGDRVGIVADLVEDDGPAVLHEPARVIRRLEGAHDGVGIGRLRPLEHVGDQQDAVVGVARVGVERLAARALLVLVAHCHGLRVLEVCPRRARHHVVQILLEHGKLARLVETRAPGADDAHDLDALLADLGQEELRARRPGDRRDDVGLGRLGARDFGRKILGRLGPRDHVDDLPRRLGRRVGRLEALGIVLAEEVIAVHEHDALGRHAGLLEDLAEVLHGLLAEGRARREVAIHVLHLLLPVLDGLGHVGGDRVGGGDVDEERHAPLLGDGHHGRGAARVERAHQHLRALVDHPLGLGPPDVGLGLRVAEDQLELRATQRLDPTRGIDGVHGHLGAESAGLPGLGERPGDRMDAADLDGRRLGAQR